MQTPWAKGKNTILKELETSENGLSSDEAKKRLEQYGKNKLERNKKFTSIKILWGQINSPLIYILLFAAIVSFVIDSKLDAIVIGIIIAINMSIGFFQQYRAENAINDLRKFIIPKATVRRDGKLQIIDSSLLVPGDIVILETGEKISADMRIISSENLEANEAILTGESTSVMKSDKKINIEAPLPERKNMLFAGTQIVAGSCTAVVVNTGSNTQFGSIASKLGKIQTQKTPMQKRIEKFSKQIGIIIIGLVILVFGLGVLRGENYLDIFMISITLAVGAIPEGLPAVMAIAFSISSALMAKNNVIIRRLPAVESLGSVTVICTDKTGTITEERMEVQDLFINNKFYKKRNDALYLKNKKIDPLKSRELTQLLETSLLSSNAHFEKEGETFNFIGDPTEISLVSNGLSLGFSRKVLTEEYPRIKTFDFDSNRKLMSILRKNNIHQTLFTKGAPEKVLEISSRELINGEIRALTPKRKKEILKQIGTMESSALRVLGFAYKNITKSQKAKEEGLIFIGLMGMMDPPREEVANAIKLCKTAGIKVKMITGDSLITGKTIGYSVGLKGAAIDSDQLSSMSDSELLSKIDNIDIFTRATPEQKLRILKTLQKNGEVVAMTGDGVNDVLALKSADVGISMGIKGTDVARDVSDIILTDDNFASIVEGVKHGRTTYDNIKKFTKYMLSINFDTIVLVTLTTLAGLPLPILPLQILWKNLITDSFPAMSLIFEKGEGVMNTSPRREKSILDKTYGFMLFAGLLNLLACGTVYLLGLYRGMDIATIRTMVMTTDVLFELSFIFSCRSSKPLRKIGIFSNKFLNVSIVIAGILQLGLLYSFVGPLFSLVPLSLMTWLYMIPLGLSGVIIYEIYKEIRYRKRK